MRTTIPKIPPIQQLILLETLHRTEELQTRPAPPVWRRMRYADYQEELAHGPRFSSPAWFNSGTRLPEAERQRFARAIDALENAGLIKRYSRFDRLTHIKLTEQGEIIARQLEEEVSGVTE